MTKAYKRLASLVQKAHITENPSKPEPLGRQDTGVQGRQPPATKVTRKEKPTPNAPQLSQTEQQLKWRSYKEFQQLLKYLRFLDAIALVESLAQRLPHDPEVRQWQAIAYSSWGQDSTNGYF